MSAYLYVSVYVSVYVYRYTYLKYCLLQVLPLYLTCTRVCVLVFAHIPGGHQPHCCGAPPCRWGAGTSIGRCSTTTCKMGFRRVPLTSLCIFNMHGCSSVSKGCSLFMASTLFFITWFLLLSTQLSMYFRLFSFPLRARSRSLCPATCQRHPQLLSFV